MTLAVPDPGLEIRGGGGEGGRSVFGLRIRGGTSPGSTTALVPILVANFCFLFAAMVSAGSSGQVMQVLSILLQSANPQ